MMSKEKLAVKLANMDFLQGADNIYRTPEFSVSQRIALVVTKKGDAYTKSEDHYYVRTGQRNADYDFACQLRENPEGKRIKTTVYVRHYHL